jgi:hypothetical protein
MRKAYMVMRRCLHQNMMLEMLFGREGRFFGLMDRA